MRANNLSICIPNKGCNKNCPYCISLMTGFYKFNENVWENNKKKVKRLAVIANINSVSLTGKGEPLLNMQYIRKACNLFKNFPLELQTNGIILKEEQDFIITELYELGIDIIAISIDNLADFIEYEPVYNILKSYDFTIRITINVTNMIPDPEHSEWNVLKYVNTCKNLGIDQLSFRKIVPANFTKNTPAHEWIKENVNKNMYYKFLNQINENAKNNQLLRVLPYGAMVWDINGIAVTSFDYCIQDTNHGNDIRSLIWNEDGHVYTAWNSKASRLF